MKHNKQFWVVAGGNGAGKSTFYHTRLETEGIPIINADILAKLIYPQAPKLHSYDAAIIAAQMRDQLLKEGRIFCLETVFSHPSKVDVIAKAKAGGYQVVLVFIHIDNTHLNIARVAQRVAEGGHDVPEEKIIKRIPRVLNLMQTAFPLCDRVYVLDNARADDPFRQIAVMNNGTLMIKTHSLPEWAVRFLAPWLI